jgi:hypothetical protein
LDLWNFSPTVVTICPASKQTEDLAIDNTAAILHRCPLATIATAMPATSVLLAWWDYYNALVNENSNAAFQARTFFNYSRNEEHNRVGEDDES